MSRKAAIYSYKFFDDEEITATTASEHSSTLQMDHASIALTWADSDLQAVVEVQVRNGEHEAWRTLNFGADIEIPSDEASGSHEIEFVSMPWTDMRLNIVRASGSATIRAVLTAKSLGG